MTAVAESTKRKLSLLELAKELDNVSKACRIMGYHRDTFGLPKRRLEDPLPLIPCDHNPDQASGFFRK